MSPRRTHGDTYVCDQCGTQQDDPIHDGWFEVSKPSPYHRYEDWWQVERTFCSAACLLARLEQQRDRIAPD
jgi:hypothetical protein